MNNRCRKRKKISEELTILTSILGIYFTGWIAIAAASGSGHKMAWLIAIPAVLGYMIGRTAKLEE